MQFVKNVAVWLIAFLVADGIAWAAKAALDRRRR